MPVFSMAKSKPSEPQQAEQKPVKDQETGSNGEKLKEGPSTAEQGTATLSVPKDFESFYLQQLTTEFADDLDRIRKANDFTERSLPVLVEALKQTANTYSEEDKRKVMKHQ